MKGGGEMLCIDFRCDWCSDNSFRHANNKKCETIATMDIIISLNNIRDYDE